jgi:hypothetical protein
MVALLRLAAAGASVVAALACFCASISEAVAPSALRGGVTGATLDYFRSRGAEISADLLVQDDSSGDAAGLGVYFRSEIPADHVVLRMPEHNILSLPRARDGPVAQALHVLEELELVDTGGEYGAQAEASFWALAVLLMFERHQPHSKWRPYLDYLPFSAVVESLPVCYSDARVEALSPYARSLARDMQKMADDVAAMLFPRLVAVNPFAFHMFAPLEDDEQQQQQQQQQQQPQQQDASDAAASPAIRLRDEWRAALALVWSRSFLLELGGSDVWGLVPVAGGCVMLSSVVAVVIAVARPVYAFSSFLFFLLFLVGNEHVSSTCLHACGAPALT